jgi:glycosyltransferase involved in cell wall biosynthesis
MKIAFVNRFDARNVLSWSGILHFMARSLEQHVGEVIYLGPDESFLSKLLLKIHYKVNKIWRMLSGKNLAMDQNRILSYRFGQFFRKKLSRANCDIIFAPAASTEIAHLKTDIPIVYFSDLTWAKIIDYYPEYTGLSSTARREGDHIEAAAITRATAAIYPSDWAVSSARNDYHAPASKTHKIQFGANLEEIPSRAAALSRTLGPVINLLWVGVDWQRKGGAIALDCLKSLHEMGQNAELVICGTVPPDGVSHPNMRVIPFIDKTFPENRKELSRLFLNAHFMLFPTRAEATGIVTCEASAHGLPSLVSNTGGVEGAINDGVNGFLMPFDSGGISYARKIVEITTDPARYHQLVQSTRDEYERCLNWDAWGKSVRVVMEDILRGGKPILVSPGLETGALAS